MSTSGDPVIHHLVAASEWATRRGDEYEPTSVSSEGFIHFSTTEQVPATSLRYYTEVADLLLITVDPARLDQELRWEDLRGTGVFPHLYGALNLDAIVAVRPYVAGTTL